MSGLPQPQPVPQVIHVRHLGRRDYTIVWRAMQAFTQARDDASPDELWLVEHPPVFTLGLNGKPHHILNAGDIPVIETDRGGQVTYHGPGQLVAYLLLDIKRLGLGVRALVSLIEDSLIGLLGEQGIVAESRKEAPGVYVAGAKVAALGLRIKQGRCYHGLSLNIDMDLAPFARINPCGYPNMAVTQLRALGITATHEQLAQQLVQHICQHVGYHPRPVDTDEGLLGHE